MLKENYTFWFGLSGTILAWGVRSAVVYQNDPGYLFEDLIWNGLCLFSLIPVSVVVIVFVMGWRYGLGELRNRMIVLGLLVIYASVVASSEAGLQTAIYLAQQQNASVKSYVARAVPVLDQIKAKTGSYPPNLPIDVLGEPPLLLRNTQNYYSVSEGVFHFRYYLPGSWRSVDPPIDFNSTDREWILSD
jgi:hypothetical protein